MVEMAEMPGFFKVNLVAGNIYMTERFSKFFFSYFFQNLVETATNKTATKPNGKSSLTEYTCR